MFLLFCIARDYDRKTPKTGLNSLSMAQEYLIAWLDNLVSITLNPKKSGIQSITKKQAEDLLLKIKEETTSIQSRLKHQIYALTREKQIRLVVVNYHTSLLFLRDLISDLQDEEHFQREELKKVLEQLSVTVQELILFLEKRFDHYIKSGSLLRRYPKTKVSINAGDKILCNLSTDQTALFLRAADELRIIKAKSMRSVFKHIAPYLSTPHKKVISFDAMRVNAYKAEEKDKEVVISELKRLIEKIKKY